MTYFWQIKKRKTTEWHVHETKVVVFMLKEILSDSSQNVVVDIVH